LVRVPILERGEKSLLAPKPEELVEVEKMAVDKR
jgi:hypothetical protein